MRDELSADSLSKLRSIRDIPESVAIELATELVEPRLGPITRIYERAPESHRLDPYHLYDAFVQSPDVLLGRSDGEPIHTGGMGLSESSAKVAALGEAIERYCSRFVVPSDGLVYTPYEAIDERAVSPKKLVKFSDSQLRDKGISQEEINNQQYHWTPSTSLVTGERRLVPAQFVFLHDFSDEQSVWRPTSTGCAAGTDLGSACYRAVSELVERECFIIGYLNQIPFPSIDLDSTNDDEIRILERLFERRNLEVTVLDASLDHPFDTCLTVAVDRNRRPAVSLGGGCAATMRDAVVDSMQEALQLTTQSVDGTYDGDPENISTIDQRARFWAPFERISDLGFWTDTEQTVPIPDRNRTAQECFDSFLTYLEKNDYNCYVTDVTTDDVRETGFRVVKALVPSFHPMHLDEQFRYEDGDRLYDVPMSLEYLDVSRNDNQLTRTPHPFL